MATTDRAIVAGDALLHPVVIASVAILVLNDHVLKAASPGLLTGKVSDFAGLAFFPLVLVAAWELSLVLARRWSGPSLAALGAATVVTSVTFLAVKVTEAGNGAVSMAMGWLQWVGASALAWSGLMPSPELHPAALVRDPSDLVALVAVGLCLAIGTQRVANSRVTTT